MWLVINQTLKKQLLFCSYKLGHKEEIGTIMGFSERSLPVHYLGVFIITMRLSLRDCSSLIEMICNKIKSGPQDRYLSRVGSLLSSLFS